jgi:hypothetical protein
MRLLNHEWRRFSEDDALWLVLVQGRWPGTKSLKEAGFFTNSSALSWYLRRSRVEEESHFDSDDRRDLSVRGELSKYRLLVEMGTESMSTVFLSGLYKFVEVNQVYRSP